MSQQPVGQSGRSSTNTTGGTGGQGSHGYCLKWRYHFRNCSTKFYEFLQNECFTDCLIACEGKVIKCHKMVLSACSTYFEQVFAEYPQQNSTLVILKDMKFSDVQAILEFMYLGEINVAQHELSSLLRASESLQVKGLADITGANNNENDNDDSTPPSPPSICMESDGGGSLQEAPMPSNNKRKRGRPPMTADSSILTENSSVYQEGDFMAGGGLLGEHFVLPRNNSKKTKRPKIGSEMTIMMDEEEEEQNDDGLLEGDDDVTEDDIQNIVKMTEYIEKGGSRPQFWEEPTTRKIMNAIRSKKMEMKSAAEILGVSYSTLYSRYRELHGYLKMPHTQDTNFNYYQVLNLLRAGQITLADAAKRLNIHEKTLGAYLSSTITPKKPRVTITPSSSGAMGGTAGAVGEIGMNLLEQVTLQGNQISSVLEKAYEDDDEEDDDDDEGLRMDLMKREVDSNNDGGNNSSGGWGR